MARRRTALWRALPAFLKFALLALSLMLSIVLAHGQVGQAQVSQQYLAQQLTQHGHAQLNQGQAAAALKTWQAATKNYRQLSNPEGVTGSLINESLALQALGLNIRACDTLTLALKLENWVCQNPNGTQPLTSVQSQQRLDTSLQKQIHSPVTVIGLRNLGDVLRLLGKPNESEITLQKALAMASSLTPALNDGELLLSLGNTERTLYNQAKNRYQLTDEPIAKETALKTAQAKAEKALVLYQQALNPAKVNQKSTILQAQLNCLSLFLELGQPVISDSQWGLSTSKTLQPTNKYLIQPFLAQLLAAQFTQLPAIESVYARLNLANSLIQISQIENLAPALLLKEKRPLDIGLKLAQTAWQVAQRLDNRRAESYALGTISKIYFKLNQATRGRQYLEKALASAQSVQAWDIAYQWQQLLGQMYKLSGDLDKATEAYAAAISSLDQVRGNILSVNLDTQFSFKEKVEPVYREYMELILSNVSPDLEQVIKLNEQMQLAELENFLECGKLNSISLTELQNSTATPATVYLIDLGQQVEVIVRSSQQPLHRHSLATNLVRKDVNAILDIIQDERFNENPPSEFLIYSQALYSQLITPIKKYLPPSGTLLFVLDRYFQNLPVAILHDGDNYLLKNYSISIALSSQIYKPKAMKLQQVEALIAGISKKSPSFNSPNALKNLTSLPEVETEIADIKKNIKSTVELLNDEFTSQRFEQEIGKNTFPIVHITTHGQFSSAPEQTVLLAWDKAIDVRQLNFLLKNRGSQGAIELLVLSACQTAKGDRRSALGIAGVATQAGAQSTLATLWLVNAESTAQLMGEFYQGLNNGMSKAEALRQAQLKLLSHPKFQHPYYWSGFILVGTWL